MMNTVEMGPVAALMVNWLLTYWLHSSILLGLTWMVVRSFRNLDAASVERFWRIALFGGIVSATVYGGLGIEPLAGILILTEPSTSSVEASSTTVSAASIHNTSMTLPDSSFVADKVFPLWPWALMGVWFLAAGIGLIRLGRSMIELRRVIKNRHPMPVGRAIRRFSEYMAIPSPVRISLLDSALVPFATGVFRPEICVPRRLAATLTPTELEAVVAHELAHVARRDPGWQMLYRAVGALLPQPLNGVARHQLEHVAELLADDLAADCSGCRQDLARSLLTVAEGTRKGADPLPVAAAVNRSGSLSERVERLLDPRRTSSASAKVVAGFAWVLVAAVMVSVPSVAVTSSAHGNASEEEAVRTWSSQADKAPDSPTELERPAVPADASELVDLKVQLQILRQHMEIERQQQILQFKQLRSQIEIKRANRQDREGFDSPGVSSEEVEKIRAEVSARIREEMVRAEERRARTESQREQLLEEVRQRLREQAQGEAEVVRESDRRRVEELRERALREREQMERQHDSEKDRAIERAERQAQAEVRAKIEAENRNNRKTKPVEPE